MRFLVGLLILLVVAVGCSQQPAHTPGVSPDGYVEQSKFDSLQARYDKLFAVHEARPKHEWTDELKQRLGTEREMPGIGVSLRDVVALCPESEGWRMGRISPVGEDSIAAAYSNSRERITANLIGSPNDFHKVIIVARPSLSSSDDALMKGLGEVQRLYCPAITLEQIF